MELSELFVTKLLVLSLLFIRSSRTMFYCKTQGFLKDMRVLDRKEMWRDWKMAHAGTWVTQH